MARRSRKKKRNSSKNQSTQSTQSDQAVAVLEPPMENQPAETTPETDALPQDEDSTEATLATEEPALCEESVEADTDADENNSVQSVCDETEATEDSSQHDELIETVATSGELLDQMIVQFNHLSGLVESVSTPKTAATDTSKLSAKIQKLQAELKAADKQNQQLQIELSELKGVPPTYTEEEMDYLCEQVMRLQNEIAELQTQNDVLQEQLPQQAYDQAALEYSVDEHSEAESENEELIQLREQVLELQQQLEEANSQPETSAAPVSAPSGTISWEQQREMMLQQMEDDTFDAENFLSEIQNQDHVQVEAIDDPVTIALSLIEQLDEKATTITELNQSLENSQAEVARLLPLAALAEATAPAPIDEQVKEVQANCDRRIKQLETEISLERAKLSRERNLLARQNTELEERLNQLPDAQKQAGHSKERKANRWMASFGATK